MNLSSLPAAFAARMEDMLGDEWPAFLSEYEKRAETALRFRGGRTAVPPSLQEELLTDLGITDPQPVPWAKNAWYYEEAQPGRALWHDMGLYYIQEPSAMAAAPKLCPEAGERVLDLCAAPGGKSSQLADLMLPGSLLISNEIHPARAKILSQNIERMGIGHAVVTSETPDRLAERFPAFFHRILVDAPCSGEGMFRKNPLAMEEWSPEQVQVCADRQDDILDCAARMLLPGGRLVYSTCTFSREEDEGSVARFLERHPDFSMPEEPVRLWPHKSRGEGHFVAVLQKEGAEELMASHSSAPPKRSKREKTNADGLLTGKREKEEVRRFLSEILTPGTAEEVMQHSLLRFGDQLYALPPQCPPLSGLRVLRPGLHLGTYKKNRIEPAYALALWLSGKEALRCADLPAGEWAERWMQGESLSVETIRAAAAEGAQAPDPAAQPPGDGWCLVTYRQRPLSWGKLSYGQLKNHMPRGLRR